MKEENKNYLRMSLEDLESSKILYLSKKYPQAIFLLQQSIEKTTKGITGIFKHAHRTPNIYKDMVNDELKKGIEILKKLSVNNEQKLLSCITTIKSLLSEINSGRLNLKVGSISVPNFLLQHILSPHANSIRYPQGKYNPLTKYTKDCFLIKHYDEIYDLQRKCLEECFKFIPPKKLKNSPPSFIFVD